MLETILIAVAVHKTLRWLRQGQPLRPALPWIVAAIMVNGWELYRHPEQWLAIGHWFPVIAMAALGALAYRMPRWSTLSLGLLIFVLADPLGDNGIRSIGREVIHGAEDGWRGH